MCPEQNAVERVGTFWKQAMQCALQYNIKKIVGMEVYYDSQSVSSCLLYTSFDFSIEEAAWSLGCPKGAAFFKVVLPNVTSGISSAFMLAFINSFNNIPVSMFLSGPGVSTFPSTLMNYIEYNYDPTVSAVSVLLMAATVVLSLIHIYISYFMQFKRKAVKESAKQIYLAPLQLLTSGELTITIEKG